MNLDEPTEAEVILAAIGTALRGLHTAAPGEVVTYDPATQTGTIRIAVDIEVSDGVFEPVQPIPEVPILWPRGTGGALHFPLAPGDGVLVVFCESDPGPWLASLGSQPALARRHGIYPVALPGFTPLARPLPASQAPATAAAFTGPAGAVGVYPGASQVQLGTLSAVDPVVLESLLKGAISTAVAAAVAAAVPEDGGKAAFAAFGSSLSGIPIGALTLLGS